VDPTGAGDCFCGTLVAGIALGEPLELSARRANAAGAMSCGTWARWSNPTLAEIDAFLAERGA
jgi:fructokinase